MEGGGTCGRCGAARTESRWCPVCGLDLRAGEPTLPTPDALEASRREAAWLERHSEAAREETEGSPPLEAPAAPGWAPPIEGAAPPGWTPPVEGAAPPGWGTPVQAWPPATGPGPAVHWVPVEKPVARGLQALGIALIAAGLLALPASAFFTFKPLFAPVHSFEAPGGGVTEHLDDGDRRVIYIQTEGTRHGDLDWRRFDDSDLGCSVRATSGGAVTRLHPADKLTLSHNEDVYVAKLDFQAPRSGRYRVECTPTGAREAPLPLAVGPLIRPWRSVAIFLAGFLGCGVLALAGGLLIWYARSGRAQRARDGA